MESTNKSGWTLKAFALIFIGLVLMFRPTIDLQAYGVYVALIIAMIAPAILLAMAQVDAKNMTLALRLAAYGLILTLGVIGASIGSSFATGTRSAVSGLKNAQTVQGLPELDAEQVPLVSREVAHRAMTRKLGEDLGLGSQFEVGAAVKQLFENKLVWVAPLEPRSTFKALFGGVSPAIMVVDASDASAVRFLRKEVRLSDREWLGLDSRVWFKDPTLMLHHWFFEIDEQGEPYWVTAVLKKNAGFRALDVSEVLLLNANTGEMKRYGLKEVPAWVDNVYAAGLVEDQIDVTGELVKGWFNPTDEGKFNMSERPDQVLVEGQMWHLGTLSSISRDEAITEAVLINARTKEMRRFSLQGLTEQGAKRALEGQNPEKRLTASNPVLYQVDGTPAYIAALSDDSNVIRAYGLVAVQDAQILAVADNLNVALKQFAAKRSRSDVALGQSVQDKELEAKVLVIRQDNASGQYFMLLQAKEGPTFLVASAPHLSDELHVTEAGDTVKVKIRHAEGSTAPVSEFKNLSKFAGAPQPEPVEKQKSV